MGFLFVKLAREIRLFAPSTPLNQNLLNTWVGTPQQAGIDPFWTLQAHVAGRVDAQTGYLCDTKRIDGFLREVVSPRLFNDYKHGPEMGLRRTFTATQDRFPGSVRLVGLVWGVSPYLSYAVFEEDHQMVAVTQSFEFSAAHRLSGQGFTDAENLRTFGKCSNPHGHGHNYVLEVTISGTPDATTGTIFDLPALQRIVRERVVEPFDHRNLNVECAEFAVLNPSVENIAAVIWQRLIGGFAPARLTRVRVWETPKTCAEYAGE